MNKSEKESLQPLVSVLMPAYNQAEYVKEAIDSVINQTYTNWELLIVDDGSPDNVAEIVKPYVENDSRIHFFHTENHGVSYARNFAASHAQGKYLLPLDADDLISPEYISKCVNHFSNNPETELVYCLWETFGTDKPIQSPKYIGYDSLLLRNSIFSSAMIPKQSFDKIGGYDENMKAGIEDWELWINLLNENSVVYQIQEPLFHYRLKKISRNTTMLKDITASYNLQLYVLQKHSEKYAQKYGPVIDAYRYKIKYYNIWYKRLWYGFKKWRRKIRKKP